MAQAFLKILDSKQEESIDQAVMTILSEIGMEVASAEVRNILAKAGCVCDGSHVYFPTALVRERVSSIPKTFDVHGFDETRSIRIGDGRSHIQPMIGRRLILDADGKRRSTNLRDVGRIVAVCDYLEHYDILHGGAVMPQIADVPVGMAHVAGFVQTLRHTGKPFKGSCRGRQVAQDCLRMAESIVSATGHRLTLHTTCNLVSPLQMAADMAEGALEYIRAGLPVDFASEPQLGATSPVTLAGTIAQGMAECLAGVVLSQTANPGCPVFVGTVAAAMDMRYTTIALGGIEGALVNAAHAQMAAYYGVPSRGTGSNTNSKKLDFQAGYEKMMTLLIPILAGIDMLFYPGTLEHAETVSLESLVLDHDLCAISLRAQEGMRITPDLLSIDLVRQAGPGGAFLGFPQTARELFSEHLIKGLWDRRRRSDWEAVGSPTSETVAAAEVEHILAQPSRSLPSDVENALAEVVKDIADRERAPETIEQLWPDGVRS
ncbi:MAG: trimethylamine methyltransferase family protein [Armatimonadetes bacterium]|nr:trimethylamine methyltransferase family protein [Armatimonadota bacterium]